jgi:hypothetical protein
MRTPQSGAPGAIEQGHVKTARHRQSGAGRADDAGPAEEEYFHGWSGFVFNHRMFAKPL